MHVIISAYEMTKFRKVLRKGGTSSLVFYVKKTYFGTKGTTVQCFCARLWKFAHFHFSPMKPNHTNNLGCLNRSTVCNV